jgi:transcriptional antiterminator RfaH
MTAGLPKTGRDDPPELVGICLFGGDPKRMQNWYLIFCKPRQERRAQENLDRQGYTTYLPRILNRRRRGVRWVQVIEPMFPRYLFIRLDELVDDWAPIRSTFGVTCMVRFGYQVPVVPATIVAGIEARETEEGYHVAPGLDFRKGERVRVLHGPMAGLEGIFAARSARERVLILLDMLGQSVGVQIDLDLIESCA